MQATPEIIRAQLDQRPEPLPLLEMGWAIYADYERALNYRSALDYDDLIRLALRALELDGDYLKRLRHRWPYILEDEAQDSSRLQERILRLLAGPSPEGNWVRVGDPNQAIFETFTTASPQFLRDFLTEPGVTAKELPNSGRSMQSIIDLANYLVEWTRTAHPVRAVREALVAPPYIEPTPPGDPQPNPPDDPAAVKLVASKFTPADELEAVVKSLVRWLPEHPDSTVAVLTPRNDRGFAVVKALKDAGIEAVELLKSSQSTREAAGALGNILAFLADPVSPKKLATAYAVWRRADREDADAAARLEHVAKALRRCAAVEDFLWPRLDAGPLSAVDLAGADDALVEQVLAFRVLACRWQEAVILPVDQLVLTIAADLFERPADLAVAHKLAVALAQAAAGHPHWRLPELTQELAAIARNGAEIPRFRRCRQRLRPGRAPRQGRGGDDAQGEGAGVGSRAPDVGQRLRFPVRLARRFVHLGAVVHPRRPQPERRGAGAIARALRRGPDGALSAARPGHRSGAHRLRGGAPAPVLRRHHARPPRADRHLEHRSPARA